MQYPVVYEVAKALQATRLEQAKRQVRRPLQLKWPTGRLEVLSTRPADCTSCPSPV
jgi:hypothetical protein